jgi:hypothetical protein
VPQRPPGDVEQVGDPGPGPAEVEQPAARFGGPPAGEVLRVALSLLMTGAAARRWTGRGRAGALAQSGEGRFEEVDR